MNFNQKIYTCPFIYSFSHLLISKMALILNIESATEICSVCISDGSQILASADLTEKFRHSEKMTLLIEEILKKSKKSLKNIDAVALSSGPGSYTSLRVGASVAKGICYALDKPLISVSTMQALAWGTSQYFKSFSSIFYRPVLDARRMEVYTQLFDSEINSLDELKPEIVDGNSFSEELEKGLVVFVGSGAEKLKPILTHPNARFLSLNCSAQFLVPTALTNFLNKKYEDFSSYEPLYLKPPNITTPKKVFGK